MYVFFICQIYYKLTYFLSLLFIVDNDLFWYAKVVKHEYEMMIPSSSSLFLFRLKACRLNGILSFARLFDVDNLYLSLFLPHSLSSTILFLILTPPSLFPTHSIGA